MISVNEISKIAEKRNKLRKETYVKYTNRYQKVNKALNSKQILLVSIPSFVVGSAFNKLRLFIT